MRTSLTAAPDRHDSPAGPHQWLGCYVDGSTTPPTTPPTSPPPGGTDTWTSGTAYVAGDQVIYDTVTYRCVRAHTAMPGWEPPYVPALWQRG